MWRPQHNPHLIRTKLESPSTAKRGFYFPQKAFEWFSMSTKKLEFVNDVGDLIPCHSTLNTIVLKYVRMLLIGHPNLSSVGQGFYLRAYTKKIHVMMRLNKLHIP